ncbi:hypothetical protein KIN20_016075 [Parelaphostrongylus tenuis]|uniref:Uncharacterized protein n=1 Tax=Parelaphostrongylus tenuis TaxID=148309 RepID=A0AAD5MKQ0_PARTN|nr:hypothetical protein KIN20_016075 [Parelaphostrongylus tenuis]
MMEQLEKSLYVIDSRMMTLRNLFERLERRAEVLRTQLDLVRELDDASLASAKLLKNHLLITNTTCCAVQLALGDALQQILHGDTLRNGWDVARSARLGASGLVIGPMMTVWYRYLDAKYVGRRLSIVVKKVLVDACSNPVFSSTIITGELDQQFLKRLV